MGVSSDITVGILVGVVVAVAGAVFNYIVTAHRDKARWAQEDKVQRERWDREDRLRDHEERRLAYENFLKLNALKFGSSEKQWEKSTGRSFLDEYPQALDRLRMIASQEVWRIAHRLDDFVRFNEKIGNAQYLAVRRDFFDAVRRDLGKAEEGAYRVWRPEITAPKPGLGPEPD